MSYVDALSNRHATADDVDVYFEIMTTLNRNMQVSAGSLVDIQESLLKVRATTESDGIFFMEAQEPFVPENISVSVLVIIKLQYYRPCVIAVPPRTPFSKNLG